MRLLINFTALVMAIVFVCLKLTDLIAWSWVKVTSPVWVVVAFWVTLELIVIVGNLFWDVAEAKRPPRFDQINGGRFER